MSAATAFARVGSMWRFYVDPDWPDRIHAREKCPNLLTRQSYWHSAGSVSLAVCEKAVRHGLTVRWTADAPRCAAGRLHRIELRSAEVARLLVARDAALERGRAERNPPDVTL